MADSTDTSDGEAVAEVENVLISFVGYDRDDWKACLENPKTVQYTRLGLDESERERPLTREDLWRPTLALVSQPDIRFAEIHLLHDGAEEHARMLGELKEDILKATPGIRIVEHVETFRKNGSQGPWDMQTVYVYLYRLFQEDAFHDAAKHYYVSCSTGTAIMRSTLFLLAFQGRIRADCIRAFGWNDTLQHSYYTPIGSYVVDSPDEFSEVYAKIRKAESPKKIRTLNEQIFTKDLAFLKTLSEISDVAKKTREPILLTGPTGSGKTYIARNIATGLRGLGADKFIQRNCAIFAGDTGLAKSDLFGHSQGAYTDASLEKKGALELADGGVLFLDEIGDLPLSVQAMLLTALEDAASRGFPRMGDNKLIKSSFQLICGTNHDLWQDVKEGRFRRDLLERINLWHYDIPGLRDRRGDVTSYAQGSLREFNKKYGTQFVFSREAQTLLQAYGADQSTPWDGNVRELKAMVFRMATLAAGATITEENVRLEIIRNRIFRRGLEQNNVIAPGIVLSGGAKRRTTRGARGPGPY